MTDKERRDKNFKLLCKWFNDADKIAEILCEECSVIEKCSAYNNGIKKSKDELGVKSAYEMITFLTAIYQCPQDYDGATEEQRDMYPELAFGLMKVAQIVGEMKQNDDSNDPYR